MLGRDQQATGAGDPATPPAAARGTHGLRSRIPAKRGEQPVHAVRALGGMAAGGGHGPAHQDRLLGQMVGAPSPAAWSGGEDYPNKERIVLVMDNLVAIRPSSRRRRGASPNWRFLHAEARELAQYSGDRTGGAGATGLDRRIPRQLARETGAWQEQRNREAIRVDWRLHHRGRPHQAQVSLPVNFNSGELLGRRTRCTCSRCPLGRCFLRLSPLRSRAACPARR